MASTSASPPLEISDPTVSRHGDATRITIHIGGAPVWFASAGFLTDPPIGDAAVALALLVAMAEQRPLDLRNLPPMSARLYSALPTIQDAWSQWNPALHPIDIHADTTADRHHDGTTGQFFSGGVHSLHAALDDPDTASRLIYVGGLTHAPTHADDPPVPRSTTALATMLQRDVVTVHSNWWSWRRRFGLSTALMHGSCLAAVAYLVGSRQITIAGCQAWDWLTPWGSHPLMDPLWSTEAVTLRHWGRHLTRIAKCRRLAADPAMVAQLHVCRDDDQTNCGRCISCVTTRLMFHLVNCHFPTAAPATDPITDYSRVAPGQVEPRAVAELLAAAREVGDMAAMRMLTALSGRLRRRQLLRELPELMTSPKRREAELMPWGYAPYPPTP